MRLDVDASLLATLQIDAVKAFAASRPDTPLSCIVGVFKGVQGWFKGGSGVFFIPFGNNRYSLIGEALA